MIKSLLGEQSTAATSSSESGSKNISAGIDTTEKDGSQRGVTPFEVPNLIGQPIESESEEGDESKIEDKESATQEKSEEGEPERPREVAPSSLNPNPDSPMSDATSKELPETETVTVLHKDIPRESMITTARNSGLAWSAAIGLFASVVFMMLLGWFVDLMIGSAPWGLVGGVILGAAIGFIQFFRTTAKILRPPQPVIRDKQIFYDHTDPPK